MGHFYNRFSDRLYHSANKEHAEYGTKNSTSSEKGTDNKKNNTSEYNHEYYEENKDKWKDNKSSKTSKTTKSDNDDLYYDKDGKARFGHKDYDANDADFKRTDGTKIEGTNLRTFTNANGSTIIMGDGIKFSFPPGTTISPQMAKKIAEIEKGDKSNKEQYVARMLNAVTGFADRQGLFGTKKSSGSGKSSSSKKEEGSTKKTEDTNKWDQTIGKYNGNPPAKTSEELIKQEQEKGKKRTEYEKKQKQNGQYAKHSDYEDLGSVLISELFYGR